MSTTPLLLLDGATGTEFDRRGVDIGMPLWSAQAIFNAPDVLKEVHASYFEAGADAIITNTFRTHQRSLAKVGMGDHAEELTHQAVSIACDARDAVKPEAMVLGSKWVPILDTHQLPFRNAIRSSPQQLVGVQNWKRWCQTAAAVPQ